MATPRKFWRNFRCFLQLYCLRLVALLGVVVCGADTRVCAFPLAIAYSAPQTQSVASEGSLTVEEVVKLSRAGFAEDLIVTKIKKNGKAFDLSTDELVELKKQGLSEALIRVMLDPTQPYTPPTPAAPAAPPGKKYPPDPLAPLVPTDAGLYFFTDKVPAKVDLKVLLGMRKGKMLKGKPTAYVAGTNAKLRLKAGKAVFYLRFPEGKEEVSDLILVSLLEKEDRREMNGLPGPKGGLNADDVLQFDQLEVGPKLFKLTPPPLDEGEYIFFLVGSAEPDKGTYGKGYDFGVDAAPTQKKK